MEFASKVLQNNERGGAIRKLYRSFPRYFDRRKLPFREIWIETKIQLQQAKFSNCKKNPKIEMHFIWSSAEVSTDILGGPEASLQCRSIQRSNVSAAYKLLRHSNSFTKTLARIWNPVTAGLPCAAWSSFSRSSPELSATKIDRSINSPTLVLGKESLRVVTIVLQYQRRTLPQSSRRSKATGMQNAVSYWLRMLLLREPK